MTEEELEQKAEEYGQENKLELVEQSDLGMLERAYKDGYKDGQKDFDTTVTKLLNSYGITFIDTDSIGGLIGFHQLFLDIEKENEELKAQIKLIESVTDANADKVEELKAQIEKLLKELKDKGIVKSWYYNGQFKWELAE